MSGDALVAVAIVPTLFNPLLATQLTKFTESALSAVTRADLAESSIRSRAGECYIVLDSLVHGEGTQLLATAVASTAKNDGVKAELVAQHSINGHPSETSVSAKQQRSLPETHKVWMRWFPAMGEGGG